jgi:PTH1 family peptidyl-tRNA hydrolase
MEGIYLIVGLGNPGERYSTTRHNIGFQVLDCLAKEEQKSFQKEKGPFRCFKQFLEQREMICAKPSTYMNSSGKAVAYLINRYGIDLAHFLVVCDDLNLPLGKVRIRKKGSYGGHNGLESIIQWLQTEEFARLRLGIDFNVDEDASDYVLSPFLAEEHAQVNEMIQRASQVIKDFIQRGIDWTMNYYN